MKLTPEPNTRFPNQLTGFSGGSRTAAAVRDRAIQGSAGALPGLSGRCFGTVRDAPRPIRRQREPAGSSRKPRSGPAARTAAGHRWSLPVPAAHLLAMVTLLVMAGVLVTCAPKAEAPAAKAPRTVKAISASLGEIVVQTEYAAQIKANEDFVVSSKIPGRLASISAKVGQKVSKGQVLFTLESRDYEAQYRQALAAAKAANANVDRTSGSAQSSQVIQAESAVSLAQVGFDDAQKLYDRTKKLVDSGVAARQQLDSVTARLDSARSQLNSAKESLKLIQATGGKQATDVVSAQAEQAQASVDLARSQLDATVVTSAINGVVTARNADPGELIAAGMPILSVMDSTAVTADLSVPEDLVGRLQQGDRFNVTVPAVSGNGFAGIVDSVAPAADQRTLGFPVKILIENAAHSLRPGMFARVMLVVARADNVLRIPNSALVMENGVDYLWVIGPDSKVTRRAVKVGLADASHTEIVSGLSAAERVVPEGQAFLNEGDTVKVVE